MTDFDEIRFEWDEKNYNTNITVKVGNEERVGTITVTDNKEEAWRWMLVADLSESDALIAIDSQDQLSMTLRKISR